MAAMNVESSPASCNLFLPVPQALVSELVSEAVDLGRLFPEILTEISADQDRVGLEKKQLRLERAQWLARRTPALPGLEAEAGAEAKAATLLGGRPRMAPETVLVFLVLSHHFHSVYAREGADRLADSLSVHSYLMDRGLALPGARTIGDNVNAVGPETLGLILRCQLQLAQAEGLDDFSEVCGDSTACAANAEHPVDSRLIHALLERCFREGSRLSRFGLPDFRPFHVPRWLEEMRALDFRISNAKKARERKKLYRKYLETSSKVILHLGEEVRRLVAVPLPVDPDPVLLARRHRCWGRLVGDLSAACHVHGRCQERVLEGKTLKGAHRILSIADEAASWIAKGDRHPVVGYKPQIARSGNGLVAALIVPEGNAADAAMLAPLVGEAVANTGVVPALASFDDGYTSAANLAGLKGMGIRDVSFSGAKGKRLLGDEAWDGDALREARRNRSAVESLMFCLKHCHQFGQLRRRGIDGVRAELAGKAVVYNFCRIVMLRRGEGARQADEAA